MPSDDVRRRRERHAEEVRRQDAPRRLARNIAIALAVLLVVAGIAYAIYKLPPGPKQLHDHATFRVVVNDRPISFNYPGFDFTVVQYEHAHIHVQEANPGAVIHMEGTFAHGEHDISFGQFLQSVGVEFRQGHLKLASVQGGATYDDDANSTLKFYVRPYGGTWGPDASWQRHLIEPCDQILVSYGPPAENLTAQFAQVVPPLGGNTHSTCA